MAFCVQLLKLIHSSLSWSCIIFNYCTENHWLSYTYSTETTCMKPLFWIHNSSSWVRLYSTNEKKCDYLPNSTPWLENLLSHGTKMSKRKYPSSPLCVICSQTRSHSGCWKINHQYSREWSNQSISNILTKQQQHIHWSAINWKSHISIHTYQP